MGWPRPRRNHAHPSEEGPRVLLSDDAVERLEEVAVASLGVRVQRHHPGLGNEKHFDLYALN